MKKKKKKYNVMWEESHRVIVEAKNEKDAINKVNEGFGSDDSAEITAGFEAFEIKEKV